MIILLMKSSRSAVATAEHLRSAITRGPFVFFRSNDLRAARLAIALSRRQAVVINTLLLFCSLVGIFGGALLVSWSDILVSQAGHIGVYMGIASGACLIGLESRR